MRIAALVGNPRCYESVSWTPTQARSRNKSRAELKQGNFKNVKMFGTEHVEPVMNHVVCTAGVLLEAVRVPINHLLDHPRLHHISQDVEINGDIDVLAFLEKIIWNYMSLDGDHHQHMPHRRVPNVCILLFRLP